MEKNIDRLKFLLLKELAAKINSTFKIDSILQQALDNSLEIVNLTCASIVLWDEKTKEIKNEVASGAMNEHRILREFDHQSIRLMRNRFSAESIYVTFDMDGPHSIFSYPIRSEKQIVGAITGVCVGHRNLSQEEEFLEALGNQLGLAVAKASGWESKITTELQEDQIKSERLKAITETAVTINHEVNTPLSVVLGYAQLLLSRKEELAQDTIDKLKKIEQGALKIKEVTHKLTKMIEPVIVKYAGSVDMLDLEKSKTKEEN
ncbi:MAG: histidine kinase dimerization/phospho-acceptor domain-containing protein [Candidatus Zixiibacteriota bacterium]